MTPEELAAVRGHIRAAEDALGGVDDDHLTTDGQAAFATAHATLALAKLTLADREELASRRAERSELRTAEAGIAGRAARQGVLQGRKRELEQIGLEPPRLSDVVLLADSGWAFVGPLGMVRSGMLPAVPADARMTLNSSHMLYRLTIAPAEFRATHALNGWRMTVRSGYVVAVWTEPNGGQ